MRPTDHDRAGAARTAIEQALTEPLLIVPAHRLCLGDAFPAPFDPVTGIETLNEGRVRVTTDYCAQRGEHYEFSPDQRLVVIRPADPVAPAVSCGCSWAVRCRPRCQNLRDEAEDLVRDALTLAAVQAWAHLARDGGPAPAADPMDAPVPGEDAPETPPGIDPQSNMV